MAALQSLGADMFLKMDIFLEGINENLSGCTSLIEAASLAVENQFCSSRCASSASAAPGERPKSWQQACTASAIGVASEKVVAFVLLEDAPFLRAAIPAYR